jgi:hypothetical protein
MPILSWTSRKPVRLCVGNTAGNGSADLLRNYFVSKPYTCRVFIYGEKRSQLRFSWVVPCAPAPSSRDYFSMRILWAVPCAPVRGQYAKSCIDAYDNLLLLSD